MPSQPPRGRALMLAGLGAVAVRLGAAQQTPYYDGPCDGAMAGAAWCDASQPFEKRAAALVANLSTHEKAGLFIATAAPVPRVDWPGYNWWSEALHGVARAGTATSFPQICGVASSYNTTLYSLIGNATAVEARGMNNGCSQSSEQGRRFHGLTMWAPNINIFRDPRWGRGQETPGEDPTLNGEYAKHFVTGMQGEDPKYLKVAACLKHYASYSQETGREGFTATVTAQDMEDTYLPAFSVGVEAGKAEGMMCSYNSETYGDGLHGNASGVPSCANKFLLNDLARGKWGFDGYITSDCGALSDIDTNEHTQNGCTSPAGCGHNYSKGILDTVKTGLHAGLDTDCRYPGRAMHYMDAQGMASHYAVDKEVAAMADASLTRLFTTQMRLGFADKRADVPFGEVSWEVVNTPAHQQLAREAADQSLVLLKNMGKTLPLDVTKFGAKKQVAVLGRNAMATGNMQGNYFGQAPYLITPCQGIKAAVGADRGATSCSDGSDGGKQVVADIAAGKVGAVVLVVGLYSEGEFPYGNPHLDEAEGTDRTSLLLPGNQDALVRTVSSAAAKRGVPVVLLTMNGGPIDLSMARDSNSVGAIMWVGYPGQSGGAAIGDALFGRTNPSGRLSVTWYPESYAKTVPLSDYRMRPDSKSGYPGRTHRFYAGPTVFPFGAGLSYTSFEHTPAHVAFAPRALTVAQAEAAAAVTLTRSRAVANATMTVSNTGSREGAEVVLLFAAPPLSASQRAATGAPRHTLVGFQRVLLRAGESTTLNFEVKAYALTYATREGGRAAPSGDWLFWTGTAEDRDARGAAATLLA